MQWRFLYASLFLMVLFLLAGFGQPAEAQTASLAHRQELEAQLRQIEVQIEAQQKLLSLKQRESESLKRDIAILDAKISAAKLSIKARDLSIQKLSSDIADKQTTIGDLTEKMRREKQSLSQLLRKTNDIDTRPAIVTVLSGNFSDAFQDIDTFESVQKALQDSFVVIEGTKAATQAEKDALEEKRTEEQELRQLQVLEKQKIEVQEREKQQILKETKGVEAAYQKLIQTNQKTAAQIRAELFNLSGSAAIPFEKALALANHASRATGVRSALILGIIAEESNLGENVGTGSWRVDMHPTRDQPIFAAIASRLGLNPDLMPVSKKPWYGWGGAMGPAQFIPSTWVLYEDRIASATGHTPPNPWNPEDAFMAAAILLKDNGAARGTPAAERLAALRYLAGWANATKRAYAFYGDDVMELAAKYQKEINVLSGSS